MLDLNNPFGFIAQWHATGVMEKWLKLGASCAIAAFVGFWGTVGITGAAVLAATHSATFALASGFLSGCLVMAASVLLSVKKSGLWKDLSIVLPAELGKIIEQTDIGQPSAVPEIPKP